RISQSGGRSTGLPRKACSIRLSGSVVVSGFKGWSRSSGRASLTIEKRILLMILWLGTGKRGRNAMRDLPPKSADPTIGLGGLGMVENSRAGLLSGRPLGNVTCKAGNAGIVRAPAELSSSCTLALLADGGGDRTTRQELTGREKPAGRGV